MKKAYFSKKHPADELSSEKRSILCFFNLHNIWWLKDKKYNKVVLKDEFSLFPDGKIISRILRIPQQRGPQFTKDYFLSKASKNKKHFFIGLDNKNLKKISKITGVDSSNIVPYHSDITKNPNILTLPSKEVVKINSLIKKSNPDYVWIGISSPKQEFIADQLINKSNVKHFMCIGAALDFLLKKKNEAPKIWQLIGVEWLYRLITDFSHSKVKVQRSFLALGYLIREKIILSKKKRRKDDRDIGIVYLAAGMSKRFNYDPKAFQEVGEKGESLIESSLNQSLKAGFNKIIIVVSDKTEPLFNEIFGNEYHGVPITYIKQSYNTSKRDKPWGQIDALCSIKKINFPFIVCNSDDLYGESTFKILYDHLLSNMDKINRESASVWYRLGDVMPKEGNVNRGIFKEKGGYSGQILETQSISRSNLSSQGLSLEDKGAMGIFALFPETILDLNTLLLEFKEKNKENKSVEYPFGMGFTKLIKEKKLKMKLYPTKSKWAGLTSIKDIREVKEYLEGAF